MEYTMTADETQELLATLRFDSDHAALLTDHAARTGKTRASSDTYRVQVDHAGEGRFTVTVHCRKQRPR